ncbi:MAG: hypothetical protein WBV93_00440 [Anaerobacillus sp.]
MKYKVNYLILLLAIISIVGCTNLEEVSNTDVDVEIEAKTETQKETVPQEESVDL